METNNFYTKPILGFRSWILDVDFNLTSPYFWHIWKPGINDAICKTNTKKVNFNIGKFLHHHIDTCDCGLYGYHSFEILKQRESKYYAILPINPTVHKIKLFGAIAGWGEVYMYKTGFRASYAKILKLFIPHPDQVTFQFPDTSENILMNYEILTDIYKKISKKYKVPFSIYSEEEEKWLLQYADKIYLDDHLEF